MPLLSDLERFGNPIVQGSRFFIDPSVVHTPHMGVSGEKRLQHVSRRLQMTGHMLKERQSVIGVGDVLFFQRFLEKDFRLLILFFLHHQACIAARCHRVIRIDLQALVIEECAYIQVMLVPGIDVPEQQCAPFVLWIDLQALEQVFLGLFPVARFR